MKVEKARCTGLCFGITRAIAMLEECAGSGGPVETLGALAHNSHVLKKLAERGIRAARDIDDIRGNRVAISSHGVSPQIEAALRSRGLEIIDTTCPFVHRAQLAARRLARAGFRVIIFGDTDHTEVKGILGWAEGSGTATLDSESLKDLPRRVGILSQTTQIPASFTAFVKRVVEQALVKDAELRIIDTICHNTRERQAAALELAKRVELMLVIGSPTSANTRRLAELCAGVTETRLAESAADIQPSWLKVKKYAGITAGASTPDEALDEAIARLQDV